MSTELPPDLADLIARLDLRPLPSEGTWFRETWRSAHGSSMIGLHAPAIGSCSRFHRLTVDETWHFHAGDPIRLVLLEPGGVHGQLLLG
ncbi:MAG: cupin domain-containing protein, partial [Armatimonadota bacterium]